jgi:uncharacterized protein with FMN-binding domain
MNTLQKSLLSAAAILSFSFYAFFLRVQDAQLVAVAPTTAPLGNTQQNSPTNSAPPSSAGLQSYINQINSQASQTQQTGAEAESQSENQGETSSNSQTATQAAQQQAAAQAQAVAQAQAQQQAAQLAAQQKAAAQAQAAAQSSGKYRNGTYTGASVNVFYGYVQVQAVIQNGQIANVVFLQYPSDRSTSRYINSQAMPMLTQEAIQAQSANVNGVSGASATSQGFVQSLGDALSQAHA